MKKWILTVAALFLFVGWASAANIKESVISVTSTGTTFACLGTTGCPSSPPQTNGTWIYCSDCQEVEACAAGGTGAFAHRVNGAWKCIDAITTGTGVTDPLALNALQAIGVTPSIGQYSINGEQNVRAYGATCSSTTATATTNGTATVTVDAIGDFQNGQYVQIDHAGATSTAVTPTGLVVTSRSSNQADGVNYQGVNGFTTCNTDGGNAGCATSYSYKIVGIDSDGGISAASSAVTITNGPTTISLDHDNDLQWVEDAANSAYAICGCSGGGCTPKLKVLLPNFSYVNTAVSGCGFSRAGTSHPEWMDIGTSMGRDDTTNGLVDTNTACPASAVPKHYRSHITGIAGTTVTLADPVSQTGTFTMRHDDAPPIQAAIDAAPSAGGTVVIPVCPAGSSGSYQIGAPISLAGRQNVRVTGQGGSGLATASIPFIYRGYAGGSVFYLNDTIGVELDHVAMKANAGTTPGIGVDIENLAGGLATSSDYIHDVEIGMAAFGISICGRGTTNCDHMRLSNVSVDDGSTAEKGGFVSVYNGHNQAFGNTIEDSYFYNQSHLFGVINQGGSLTIKGGVYQPRIMVYHRFTNGQTTITGAEIEISNATPNGAGVLGGCAGGRGPTFIGNQILVQPSWPNVLDYSGSRLIGNFLYQQGNSPDGTTNFYAVNGPVWVANDMNIFGGGTNNPFAKASGTQTKNLWNSGVSIGDTIPKPVTNCNDNLTVTTNTTLNFSKNSCQKITTATTGLTYTLSTTGVTTGQVVEVDSNIAGAITGPLWATSSGAIKWQSASPVVSSGTSGYLDVIAFKFDGTDWIELGRALAIH